MRFPSTIRGVLKSYEHETDDSLYYFRIEYAVTAGERAVMYDRDGGGYPGSPPECEIQKATCLRIVGEDSDKKLDRVEGENVGNWFMEQIEADSTLRERVEEYCYEDAADRFGDDDRY